MIKNYKNKITTKHILDFSFRTAFMFGALFFVLITATRLSHANEIENLLNKLVEKGVLTSAEAQAVLVETREEERVKIAQQKHDILPEWIQKIKVKGDLRLREQYQKLDDSEDRWRTRLRYRLGIESQIVDRVKVGFGIASGGSDPRSTNQTLSVTFSSKGINLDLAYGQYDPFNWLTLVGGKFKNPIFTPDDLIWDSDINPEGGAALLNYKWDDRLGLFMNTGFFVLDERNSADNSGDPTKQDPFMYVLQPGFEWKIKTTDYKDMANLKASIGYYGFIHVQDNVLDNSGKTNTGWNTGLLYDYNSFFANAQLGFMPQEFIVPYLGIFGEFVYNPDPSKGNKGWLLGGVLGVDKVKERGQWQFKYMYRELGRDAILDCLPDSDFLEGATDVKGHEAIFEYGISKNMSVALDYYRTKQRHGDNQENLLQLDWNLKF